MGECQDSLVLLVAAYVGLGTGDVETWDVGGCSRLGPAVFHFERR